VETGDELDDDEAEEARQQFLEAKKQAESYVCRLSFVVVENCETHINS
jgi:hypothetical protein